MSTEKVCPSCGSTFAGAIEATTCNRCRTGTDGQTEAATEIFNTRGTTGVEKTVAPQVVDKVKHVAPAHFADYELLEEIARGGMGVVYRARQTRLDRTVALKMILAGTLASEQDVQRFYTEAEAAAKLQHPHIVSIHDIGQHEGQHYFSMDFVEGHSLAEVIHTRPVTTKQAAEYVKRIADAIQYAHEQGILHRDLKPANVLVDLEDQPRITDFGLAKQMEGESNLTGTGQILGTPGYMPPEQASGRTKDLAATSDVYSIGAILYELLTGRPPFRADSPLDTLNQVLNEEPVSPRQLNPTTSRDLDTICLKCLEKEPAKRYQTARELEDELDRFLSGAPIEARPITRTSRLLRWCRRRPVTAGLTATVMGLLLFMSIAGPLIAVYQTRLKADEADTRRASEAHAERAETAANNEIDARQAAAQSELKNRKLLYATDMLVASQAWQAANIFRVTHLLQQHTPQGYEEDLRKFEWYYLAGLRFEDAQILNNDHPVHAIAVSPNGKHLAVGAAHLLSIWDRRKNELIRQFVPHEGVVSAVAFSPDGTQLATAGEDRLVKTWQTDSGQLDKTFSQHTDLISSLSFAADGKLLASGRWDHSVCIWETQTGRLTSTLKAHNHEVSDITFLPDGKRLASASHDLTTKLWNVDTGEVIATLAGHKWPVSSVAVSGDGNRLATGSLAGGVIIWDVQDKKMVRRLVHHSAAVTSLAFSPDDSTLVAGCFDNRIAVWDAKSLEPQQPLIGHMTPVTVVVFAQDNQLVSGSYDGTARIWNRQTRQGHDVLLGHKAPVTDLACSAKGLLIASASEDGQVILWNGVTNERIATLSSGGPSMLAVKVSEKGEFVVAGSASGHIYRWNVATRAEVFRKQIGEAAIHSLDLDRDQKQLAISTEDGRVLLCNLDQPDQIRELPRQTMRCTAVEFSPNGKDLAVSCWDGHARVFRVSDGTLKFEDHAYPTGGDSRASLIVPRFDSGHEVLKVPPVTTVRYMPNGTSLAVVEISGLIDLIDAQTGQRTGRILNNGAYSRAIGFAPECSTLASAGMDNLIQLTDVQTASPRTRLPGHVGPVTSLTFANEKTLVSGGADHSVRIWRAATAQQIAKQMPQLLGFKEHTTLLSDQIEADPTDLGALRQRAELYCRSAQWQKAELDFRRLIDLDPNDHWHWYKIATLMLKTGDVAAHQLYCEEMIRRFENEEVPEILERTVKICLARADVNVDRGRVAEMMKRAWAAGENDQLRAWFELGQGMKAFRSDRLHEAEGWLRSAIADADTSWEHCHAQSRLVLAMVLHQLNQKASSAGVLNEALELIDGLIDEHDYGAAWNDVILCEVLRDEAITLIRGANQESP